VRIYLATGGATEDMKIYLVAGRESSGTSTHESVAGCAHQSSKPPRMLLSFHYYGKSDIKAILDEFAASEPLDVFADSGAFSAVGTGVPLQPERYVEWASKWGHLFTALAAPDVIGDPEATARETEKMLQILPSHTVLPVFHFGEPWEFLEHWVKRCGYIALGGMVPYVRRQRLLKAWLTEAFSRIPTTTRIHGFGLTTFSLLRAHPWYSVDSSSWGASVRYGTLVLFNTRTGRQESVDMRKRAELMRHREVLGQYGLTPSDVMNTNYERKRVVGATIASWSKLEAWLTAREAKHGEEETGA
jgi:hypothetical protein